MEYSTRLQHFGLPIILTACHLRLPRSRNRFSLLLTSPFSWHAIGSPTFSERYDPIMTRKSGHIPCLGAYSDHTMGFWTLISFSWKDAISLVLEDFVRISILFARDVSDSGHFQGGNHNASHNSAVIVKRCLWILTFCMYPKSFAPLMWLARTLRAQCGRLGNISHDRHTRLRQFSFLYHMRLFPLYLSVKLECSKKLPLHSYHFIKRALFTNSLPSSSLISSHTKHLLFGYLYTFLLFNNIGPSHPFRAPRSCVTPASIHTTSLVHDPASVISHSQPDTDDHKSTRTISIYRHSPLWSYSTHQLPLVAAACLNTDLSQWRQPWHSRLCAPHPWSMMIFLHAVTQDDCRIFSCLYPSLNVWLHFLIPSASNW